MSMKSITITQAKENFDTWVDTAITEPFLVTKQSKEIFVIVPFEEFNQMKGWLNRKNKRPQNLLDFIGLGKQYARFSSVEEVDRFIASNRELWQI